VSIVHPGAEDPLKKSETLKDPDVGTAFITPTTSSATGRSRNRLRGLPLYLTEAQVGELLSPADALAAIEACFERLARGEVENRPRTRTRLPDGVFAVMSAADHELGLAGVKSYAWLPGGTPFVVVLFDTERAELAGVIEAD
jgi:hypothetical protein